MTFHHSINLRMDKNQKRVLRANFLNCFQMFMNSKLQLHKLVIFFLFCRYVVEPYRKYPNLLEVLLNFLKTEQAPGIRREVKLHELYFWCENT